MVQKILTAVQYERDRAGVLAWSHVNNRDTPESPFALPAKTFETPFNLFIGMIDVLLPSSRRKCLPKPTYRSPHLRHIKNHLTAGSAKIDRPLEYRDRVLKMFCHAPVRDYIEFSVIENRREEVNAIEFYIHAMGSVKLS